MIKLKRPHSSFNYEINVLTQNDFNRVFYIKYKNAFRQCKIVSVETHLFNLCNDNSNIYAFFTQKIKLNIAQIGEVTLCLDRNKSSNDYQYYAFYDSFIQFENKSLEFDTRLRGCELLSNIINIICDRKVCYDDYNHNISTYKFNGIEPVTSILECPNLIIQDKNGFSFGVETTSSFVNCYSNIKDCKLNNSVKIIKFDDEENNELEIIDTLDDIKNKTIELKSLINKLSNLNKNNIDDEILKEWAFTLSLIKDNYRNL